MAKAKSAKTKRRVKKDDKYARAFKRGILERGEAALPDPSGKLPPGATHEIVGQSPDGLPEVKRRRFSLT
jgi:hypothetical protein